MLDYLPPPFDSILAPSVKCFQYSNGIIRPKTTTSTRVLTVDNRGLVFDSDSLALTLSTQSFFRLRPLKLKLRQRRQEDSMDVFLFPLNCGRFGSTENQAEVSLVVYRAKGQDLNSRIEYQRSCDHGLVFMKSEQCQWAAETSTQPHLTPNTAPKWKPFDQMFAETHAREGDRPSYVRLSFYLPTEAYEAKSRL